MFEIGLLRDRWVAVKWEKSFCQVFTACPNMFIQVVQQLTPISIRRSSWPPIAIWTYNILVWCAQISQAICIQTVGEVVWSLLTTIQISWGEELVIGRMFKMLSCIFTHKKQAKLKCLFSLSITYYKGKFQNTTFINLRWFSIQRRIWKYWTCLPHTRRIPARLGRMIRLN